MQLIVPLTDTQSARTRAAYGVLLNLGRDATDQEVAQTVIDHLRVAVISVENNVAAQQAVAAVRVWDAP